MTRFRLLPALLPPLVCSFLVVSPLGAAGAVWIEAESPTRANFEVSTGGWGNAGYLSGGDWLHFSIPAEEVEKKVPAGGIVVGYEFEIEAAGERELWGRVGYEFVRSPFEWRIDSGAWDRIDPREDLSTDLMEIARWNEIAWAPFGKAPLGAGRHTLEIRLPISWREEGGKRRPGRLLFSADAYCLTRGRFFPNGKHRPGRDARTGRDRAAAQKLWRLGEPPGGGRRGELLLAGDWEIARFDERESVRHRSEPTELPGPEVELHWSAIAVPGDRNALRPDLKFCHRYLYRARVEVPAAWRGGSFLLDFDSTSLFVTVYVNGRRVGFCDTPRTGFTADATGAVRAGEENEIVVAVKDAYYAIEPSAERPDTRLWFNTPLDMLSGNQGVTMRFDQPVKGHTESGILDRVRLVATGPAWVEDVFAVPSVKEKRLGLELALRNSSREGFAVTIENEVAALGGGSVAKRFAPREARLAPGGRLELRLQERWANPHLWWPDDPFLYEVITRVRSGGRPIDEKRTRFGFREWTIESTRFVLNGVPWQLRANLDFYSAAEGEAEGAVAWWRRSGQNMFRLRFQKRWGGMTQREALDFFDAHGVPVRRTVSTLDGQHASYGLVERVERDGERVKVARRSLFESWRRQIRERCRRERNHPSIFVWELDNEIVYINARNFGNLDVVEPEFTRAAREVRQIDSQWRGVMVAGGRALMDQTLPINGCHYEEAPLREYPDMAYALGKWTAQSRKQPWPMALDRPIFLSETYYARGWHPSVFAAVGGERCFLGRAETRAACGLIARMFSEGYRWQELGAFHYWFGRYGSAHYKVWQPVVALSREWNSTFGSGEIVRRTIMVRNDTRRDDPIDLDWELRVGGKKVAGDRVTTHPAPGHGEIVRLRLPMPRVERRTEGELRLACRRGGREVWSEAKPIRVIDPDGAPRPRVERGDIVVWDPRGAALRRLRERGVPLGSIAKLGELPGEFRLLVVGDDALDARSSTDPLWRRLAASGKRVLVLEQEHPLHYQAVPADLEPTGHTGRIAFPEDLSHPAFRGLAREDFFTWSGDHIVYRNAWRKATRGARSLLQCDERLADTALVECPVGEGLLLLSQAVVGAKLSSDPVARRLFDNLVNRALEYRLERRPTTVVLEEGDPRLEHLEKTGLVYRRVGEVGAVIADPKRGLVIVGATAHRLAALASRLELVRAFTERGGWLVLWNVGPEGLADFNRLVGVEHVLRPFRREKVSLAAVRDPLSSGLSERDVTLSSGERIFGWTRDEYADDAVFTHVVDLEDIAPFCRGRGIEGTASIVNGLTSADAWKYIVYLPLEAPDRAPTLTLRFPRRETVTGFSIVPNAHYWLMEKVKLLFDGEESKAREIELAPYDAGRNDRQDFELEPVEARSLTIVPLAWKRVKERAILGIDNLWIRVKRPADFRERVKPLLSLGALVRYPRGRGGIVLDQLRVRPREPVPENEAKKLAITAAILRNLHAVFRGREGVVPGEDLIFRPVSLEGIANLYITAERGWPEREHDLSRLPRGRQRFAGVEFEIRDFETSPLEHAVTLRGMPGAKAPREVRMLVGEKADALFFLHTFFQRSPWRPRREGEEPPILWKYTVRWADGKRAGIPVRLGIEAADYRARSPQGLRDAGLAWDAPFAEDPARSAALWQFQWDNPRPEEPIESVTLGYDEKTGSRYGAPVLVGLTAARRR